jgi:hypothetical protein
VDEDFPADLFSALEKVEEFSHVFDDCINMQMKRIPSGIFKPMILVERLKYPFCNGTVHGNITGDLLHYNSLLEEVDGLFDHQSNMSGTIPSTLFASCPNLTSVRGAFLSAYGLTGEIPGTLFSNNPNLVNVSDCFSGTRGLSGSVPANLFANCPKLVNARWCFENSGIGGNIPENLFANCPVIENIGYLFSNTQINGPLPAGFIKNKKSLVNVDRMFENCNIGGEEDNFNEFPADFFEGLTALQSANYCFSGCRNLKFTLPAGLFKDCINLKSIDYLFYNCKGIRGGLNSNIFVINGGAYTNAVSVLEGCSGISGNIPEDFFEPFINVKDLSGFFSGCAGITGVIPTALLQNCTNLIYANRLFKGTGLGKHRVDADDPYFIDPNFFRYNVYLEEIDGMFDAADAPRNLIGAIPPDLFRYNVNLIDAGSLFANCTGITGELNGAHFRYNAKLQDVSNMFYNSSITSITNDVFNTTNNPVMNDFTATFKGLNNLTGTAPALWDMYPGAARNECFLNCNNLTNFAAIPDSWK